MRRFLSHCTICYWLTDWCNTCKIDPSKVTFRYDRDKYVIYVYTSVPGVLIGQYGKRIEDARTELNTICEQHKTKKHKIELVEVTRADYWVNYPYSEEF